MGSLSRLLWKRLLGRVMFYCAYCGRPMAVARIKNGRYACEGCHGLK